MNAYAPSPTPELVPCQWWAACDRLAVTTQAHPFLGPVPICTACKGKYDRL